MKENVTDVRRVAIEHHHQVAEVFESHYSAMEKDRFSNAFTYGRNKVDRMIEAEFDRLPKGARILDVGCGTGHYLVWAREKGLTPSGLEPASAMRTAAQQRNPGVEVVDAAIHAMPFATGTFDFVMAIEVIRYLDRNEHPQAFAEMLRVLKPGGRLFVTAVNRFALDGFYVLQRARQLGRKVSYDERHPHCDFTTPAELEAVLRQAGGTDVRTAGCLFAPIRMLYKLNQGLASQVARRIESVDDRLSSLPPMKPFAGHLVGTATKP